MASLTAVFLWTGLRGSGPVTDVKHWTDFGVSNGNTAVSL